ncbi:alcohol dehydrogenase-like 4 [Tripterygium wilfordii]|uniref:alcohol dehydrogenase n=1 Tax=Tripterygium wilfordii TaxID=458696 RepID=A0A7J7CJY0_TRIWF|nr:alcohol dehydrogenase-like 3 isoform X1 [Tripterygium wilfordii]XP_038680515.1 alcohol dehydrogenase-like 3 isoform X1 [Tripterygium wilfordii]XP_038680516.1 alcohol dehydrogenase-like 3 isoform X1 [Tripterygium wilfordii]KAF5734377.1 alcohol dehydrogenase-like 4 [Tripterygium wilfordii]
METTGKVITCKAAVVWGPGEPFVIEQILVDPPQKMEVRIKILFTSICHTDLGFWKGENEAHRAFPRILGHEAAGIVESVGEGVKDMKEGDNVVPIFNGECGECKFCKNDKTNMCKSFGVNPMKSTMFNDGKCRFSTKEGKPIFHFLNTSTFSEYTVLDSACVVKIDPQAPLHKMSLLSCCLTSGVGAAWNTADVQAGSSVAIFGLGSVGLAVAQGARARGASKIIGVDPNPEKFIKAQMLGVTDYLNPKNLSKPEHEVIREMTGGGVDYSFECVGNLDVLREAFLSTHEGCGYTVILGIYHSPRTLPLHPMELLHGRSIVGSIFGGFKGKTQLPCLAKKCMAGVLNLDEFITHDLPFEKINEAVQLLIDGKSLRCLLHL